MTEYTVVRVPQYHIYRALLGDYDPTKDYVGAEGDWKAILVPKRLLISRINFNPSAYIHDGDYIIGGCEECRKEADRKFYDNMISAVNQSGPHWPWGTDWARKQLGLFGADTYYFAVDRYGSKAFNYHEECRHRKV